MLLDILLKRNPFISDLGPGIFSCKISWNWYVQHQAGQYSFLDKKVTCQGRSPLSDLAMMRLM